MPGDKAQTCIPWDEITLRGWVHGDTKAGRQGRFVNSIQRSYTCLPCIKQAQDTNAKGPANH